MSDSESENHQYNTRSKNKNTVVLSKQDKKSIVRKKKIPVEDTLPKRCHSISSSPDNKESIKGKQKKYKFSFSDNKDQSGKSKIMKNNNDKSTSKKDSKLGDVIGELFVAGLVEESNKLLEKKRKKREKKEKKEKKNNEDDEDEAINDITSDSDSDSESDEEYDFPKIDGLPKGIDYTEDEHKYMISLTTKERNEFINKEKKILALKKNMIPIRFKILSLKNITDHCKQNIIDRLDHFYSLESTDNEYHKLSTWVDCLEKMPFDTYINLPVTINDGFEKINQYLSDTRRILNDAVYGHEEAKEKIIMTLSKQLSNPTGVGVCIGIEGPMGNGKTTLVKEGICKAVKRPFGFVALGGMQDSNIMLGHDYTYEGSKPGKIVEILNDCKCMNPVIYFDELDKISKCVKGDEIENFLCHLTDTSQNYEFHDKYLSRVNLNLSKIIYIFSYNDPSKVNPILLDRLFKIKTEGFNQEKKLKISKEYLLPRIYKDYNIDENVVSFTDAAINKIIEKYANKEEGVRNLKGCLDTIVSKINVLRFLHGIEIKPDISADKSDNKNKNIDNNLSSEIVPETVIPDLETVIPDLNEENKDKDKECISDIVEEPEKSDSKILDKDECCEYIVEEPDEDNCDIKHSSDEKIDSIEETIENDDDKEKIVEETTDTTDVNIKIEISDKIDVKISTTNDKDNKEEVKETDSVVKQEILDMKDILSVKIKDFKLPFVVDENNLDKFLKSHDSYNPSLSHLYL